MSENTDDLLMTADLDRAAKTFALGSLKEISLANIAALRDVVDKLYQYPDDGKSLQSALRVLERTAISMSHLERLVAPEQR
jgi:hypothetical protein